MVQQILCYKREPVRHRRVVLRYSSAFFASFKNIQLLSLPQVLTGSRRAVTKVTFKSSGCYQPPG